MPQVAIFLPGLYGGGAERVTLNLARGLAARGYTVDLLLARAEGPYRSEVPAAVHMVELNPGRLPMARTLAALPALVVYLRRARPPALLSALHANVVALWAGRLAGRSTRVVVSEHNTFSYAAQSLPTWRRWMQLQLTRWFYPWAAGIVAVSAGAAEDLVRAARISSERIRVIPNPIITPELREKRGAPLEHPWFGPGQPPVVLGVGRLCAQKGFAFLLQAFARVRRRQSARLLILGDGPLRPQLEKQIRHLGLQDTVSLAGFVDNPYPYMAGAALFVLSSNWEGLPTVLVEALYCGTPVVATDCPSGPREILAGGTYGRLVPPGDVDGLAQAIEAALDEGRRPPPPESWAPYQLETAVDHYLQVLLEA